MATLAARGSGTPVTSGTTWATLTNAVDGTAGTNPATYTTYTNATASAVGYIEISGYNFSTSVGASDTLNSVTVNLRHFENNTGRFASVRFQPYDGATAIGSIFTATLATAARNDSTTFPVTLAQLRSSTFKIRVTITGAASTQSRVESIDYVDVTADYTPLPPAITQAAFRFYADGTETGSTALAAQDTGYTADTSSGDVNLQVRARLQSTNAVAPVATDDWQLQWEKNASGSYADVAGTSGEVLASSYSQTNVDLDTTITNSGMVAHGQSFLGNGQVLSRAGFWIKRFGTAPGTVSAILYAHTGTFGSGGTGTGSPLVTSTTTVTASTVATTYAWSYFNFPETFTLVNGTPYVIAVAVSVTGTDGANAIATGVDVSSPTHAGNQSQRYSDTTWAAGAIDRAFEVYTKVLGTTVVPYASANLTDGAATTNRLGAGSGSFVAGKISETGLVTDLGWSANNYTEVLYSVTLKQADLGPTDTLASDDFNRADGALGSGWTTTAGSAVISGNKVVGADIGANDSVRAVAPGIGNDQWCEAYITAADTYTWLVVRGDADDSDRYSLVCGRDDGGRWVLNKNVGGSETDLAVGGSGSGPTGTYRLEAEGTTIRAYVNGTKVAEVTDAAVTTGGIGFGFYRTGSATGSVDNFLGGNLTDTVRFRVLRNGATTGLTYTQVPTVTIGAAGPVDRTGTAAGAITVAGSSSGTKDVTATATGTLTVAGAAAGAPGAAGTAVVGTAVGALTVVGVAAGTKQVTATAVGQLTLVGVSTGIHVVAATATGALTVAGTSSGVRDTRATVTGSLTLAGTATGVRTFNGVATGALTVTGVASGIKTVTATATGAITVAGTATGRRVFTGTATGAITVASVATGQKTVAATAVGAVTLAGTAAATKQVTASATGQIVFGSTALGLVEGNAVGTAVGTITLGGTATGARGTKATATGALSLAGTAVARRGTAAVATGALTLAGAATATKQVTATAVATISLAGTATGGAPVTFEIIGEWNDQQVDALQWGDDAVVEWFMLTAVQVNATATGGLTLGGAAAGYSTKQGHATGVVAIGGTAAGTGPTWSDILLEDFANYTDAPWTVTGSPSIAAARTGNGASIAGATDRVDYSIASGSQTATLTIGFAWRVSSIAANRHPIILLSDSGATTHVTMRVTTTGAVAILRGTSIGTVLGTSASTGLVAANTWVYLELQATLGDSPNGSAIIRVNGTERLNVPGVDTKNGGTKVVFDQIRIGQTGSGITGLYDDLYVTTGAGAPFKGDITIP